MKPYGVWALYQKANVMPWRIEDELRKIGANYAKPAFGKGLPFRWQFNSPVSKTLVAVKLQTY